MITTLLIEIIVLIVIIIFLFWWITDSVAMFRAAPFVASKYEDVEKILKLSEITAGKNVLELGSGNGETCIRAAERGAYGKRNRIKSFSCHFCSLEGTQKRRHLKMRFHRRRFSTHPVSKRNRRCRHVSSAFRNAETLGKNET